MHKQRCSVESSAVKSLRQMSRGTLLDAVNDAIFTERSLSAIRTERADRVDLLAVGCKWEPEQTGRAPVDDMTRKGKGGTDKKQGNSKGKDTEKEKGERSEGYCGHSGNGGTDKRVVCWSRQVCRAETDAAELQDVDPTSKQTPVPGGTETHLKHGACQMISSQSAYHAQQEFEDRTSFEDNDAVEHECSPHCCSGMPTPSASRVVSRVSLRTVIGEKVKN